MTYCTCCHPREDCPSCRKALDQLARDIDTIADDLPLVALGPDSTDRLHSEPTPVFAQPTGRELDHALDVLAREMPQTARRLRDMLRTERQQWHDSAVNWAAALLGTIRRDMERAIGGKH